LTHSNRTRSMKHIEPRLCAGFFI